MGLCAGAWLGGGTGQAALIENFGLFASAYHLLRGQASYGIPTLIVAEYRGDAGDQEFFAETGDVTEPFLEAIRVNHRVVRDLRSLKPAIRDGVRWMDFALRPYAVLPGYDLTRARSCRLGTILALFWASPEGHASEREAVWPVFSLHTRGRLQRSC